MALKENGFSCQLHHITCKLDGTESGYKLRLPKYAIITQVTILTLASGVVDAAFDASLTNGGVTSPASVSTSGIDSNEPTVVAVTPIFTHRDGEMEITSQTINKPYIIVVECLVPFKANEDRFEQIVEV
jgi:hypothetical protein